MTDKPSHAGGEHWRMVSFTELKTLGTSTRGQILWKHLLDQTNLEIVSKTQMKFHGKGKVAK